MKKKKDALPWWPNSLLCRHLRTFELQTSNLSGVCFSPFSTKLLLKSQTAPLQAGAQQGGPSMTSWHRLRLFPMERMGIPLRRRSYREAARGHPCRVPASHSGAAAVGKSTKLLWEGLLNPPSPERTYNQIGCVYNQNLSWEVSDKFRLLPNVGVFSIADL